MASLTAANAVSTPILCADDDDWAPLVTKSADTKTPLVVAFGAGWCGPCKVLKPVFRALAKEWTAKDPGNAPIFVEVDVDEGKVEPLSCLRMERGDGREAFEAFAPPSASFSIVPADTAMLL